MAELFKLYQQQEDRLKKKRQKIESNAVSAEISDDGAFEQQIGPEGLGWGSGGVFAKKISLESAIKEEMDLIRQYRYMMQHPECDNGVQEIVGEAIILDEAESPVSINLDATDLSESTKKKIIEEFDTILDLLNFDDKGQDLFSRWYIDARLAIQKITLKENRKKGIVQLRVLEPTKLKKVRTIEKGKNEQGIEVIKSVKEHYIYADQGLMYARTGLEIPVHAISYITSGLVNENGAAISYLHKAIRPLNHLKFMEDSLIIYRLARAPERRIFYVDVGSLPPKKAESYLKSIMNQHKNKISYDAETGSVVSEKSFNTIMEDYWLPRREGSRGTEVSTLPGGQNLSEIDDVLYFQKKLFRALNVPLGRIEPDTTFSFGRATEITREEVRFQKFISKLRRKFSMLFKDLLRTQLDLKGIMSLEEWEQYENDIFFVFLKDNYFAELKEMEVTRERMGMLNEVEAVVGRFVSRRWVQKNILRFTDEEIAEIDKENAEDKENIDDSDKDIDLEEFK